MEMRRGSGLVSPGGWPQVSACQAHQVSACSPHLVVTGLPAQDLAEPAAAGWGGVC